MDKYEIMLYPRAYRDIHDIYAYIALEKLSPETAKEQTDRIWQAIKKLELFPKSHQDRLVGRYAGKEYKQLIIDNYIAIFKVVKKKNSHKQSDIQDKVQTKDKGQLACKGEGKEFVYFLLANCHFFCRSH